MVSINKNKGNAKQTTVMIVAIAAGLVIFLGLCWGMGWFGVFYRSTVGVAQESANRDVYKQNKSYVEGMINDLGNYKYELETEKDETAKTALIGLVRSKYANFDSNLIQDLTLRQFLLSIRNGTYDTGGLSQ
jgi:hypothetical protein